MMYVCMYVSKYFFMYVCLYVCMYVYIPTYLLIYKITLITLKALISLGASGGSGTGFYDGLNRRYRNFSF
jgi:hypothetical protein